MSHGLRVVHYLNQFFGGLGGEDRAGEPPLWRSEPVGPGQLLEESLAGLGRIVGTVICGDNYFNENEPEALERVLEMIRAGEPDLVLAGPAFNSGRYGLACVSVCASVEEELKIPALTALYPENPAVIPGRQRHLWIAKAAETALEMKENVTSLVQLGWKVATGATMGASEEEGYIPRGFRRNAIVEKTGAERSVEALLKKLRGEIWNTELPLPDYDSVPPPSPVSDLSECVVALITESSVVPVGNPDQLESWRASKWLTYSLDGVSDLTGERYQTVHGGFENTHVNEDPDRAVPLDALRSLEQEGVIGKLHPDYYVTTGMATTMINSQRIGREIAADLMKSGIAAAVLTAT